MKQLDTKEIQQVAGGLPHENTFYNDFSFGILIGMGGYAIAGPAGQGVMIAMTALFTIGMFVPEIDRYIGLR